MLAESQQGIDPRKVTVKTSLFDNESFCKGVDDETVWCGVADNLC